MNCPRCGIAYQPGAPFCPSCGFNLILREADFTTLATKARAYYRDLRTGRLTQAQYNAAIQNLTLLDPAGGLWSTSMRSGEFRIEYMGPPSSMTRRSGLLFI
jgi:hypothetical protein